MKVDTIIIGSGIGGLTCANLLAKQGQSVLVLEQHFLPGGFCTSYTRSGCRFDVPVIIGNLRPGDPMERLFSEIGITSRLDFVELDRLTRIKGPDITLDWYTDLYKLEYEFIDTFPEDRKEIQKGFQALYNLWKEVGDAHYSPTLLQMAAYPFRFPRLTRSTNDTLERFMKRHFSNPRLREVFGKEAITLGLGPDRVSALMFIGFVLGYAAGGIWVPKGGFQKLSDTFVECLKEAGGEIRLKTRVEKILVESNRAVGVRLEDGEEIRASRVISNADTKKTFLELIGPDDLPKKTVSRIKAAEQSLSGVVVKLGVKKDFPDLKGCAWLFEFSEYGSTEKMVKQALCDELDLDSYSFSVDTAALADREGQPDGMNTVGIVYLPAPYGWKNKWNRENRDEYLKLKEDVATSLINRAERLLPGLKDSIAVKDISTPITYERYTSASGGGWYDLALKPDQCFMNRPGVKSPVQDFYMTGAKGFIGAGLNAAAVSGLVTADMVTGGGLTAGKTYLKDY